MAASTKERLDAWRARHAQILADGPKPRNPPKISRVLAEIRQASYPNPFDSPPTSKGDHPTVTDTLASDSDGMSNDTFALEDKENVPANLSTKRWSGSARTRAEMQPRVENDSMVSILSNHAQRASYASKMQPTKFDAIHKKRTVSYVENDSLVSFGHDITPTPRKNTAASAKPMLEVVGNPFPAGVALRQKRTVSYTENDSIVSIGGNLPGPTAIAQTARSTLDAATNIPSPAGVSLRQKRRVSYIENDSMFSIGSNHILPIRTTTSSANRVASNAAPELQPQASVAFRQRTAAAQMENDSIFSPPAKQAPRESLPQPSRESRQEEPIVKPSSGTVVHHSRNFSYPTQTTAAGLNLTTRSFILPDITHLEDLVAGDLRYTGKQHGVPVFAKQGRARYRAEVQPPRDHVEIDGIPVGEDEEHIFVSMETIRREVRDLKEHDEALHQYASELESEVDRLKKLVEKQNVEFSDERTHLETKIVSLERLVHKNDQKRESLGAAHEADKERLQDEISRLSRQAQHKELERAELIRSHKAEKERLEKENKALRGRLDHADAIDVSNDMLFRSNDALEKSNVELRQSNTILRRDQESSREHMRRIRREQGQQADEIARLKCQNQALHTLLDGQLERLKMVEVENAKLQGIIGVADDTTQNVPVAIPHAPEHEAAEPATQDGGEDATERPSQPPREALKFVIEALRAEEAAMRAVLQDKNAQLNALPSTHSRRARERLQVDIERLFKELRAKGAQMYALQDVLVAQERSEQDMPTQTLERMVAGITGRRVGDFRVR